MYEVSVATFLVSIIPLYGIVFLLQSRVLYGRVCFPYLIFFVLGVTVVSALFSTFGEIIFGVLYSLYLLVFKPRVGLVSFVLLWEAYLFVNNIVATFIGIVRNAIPQRFDLITFLGCLIINVCIIGGLIFCVHRFSRSMGQLVHVINTDSPARNAFVFYSSAICLCVYIIEYVFEKMNLALTADWFVTGIFVFMVIINFGSLYFLYHDIKINVENKLLRSSEQAKQQYYADLELQQTHTRKVLHDYKNVLAALQLSLDKDAPAEATMQTRQVIESAQATLNDIQPNNSALSMITTLPLRSLLYLKWTEASNKGVRLNIQSDGTVTISNNTDLLDVLRVVGILVDNAVEAATGGEEADVLLTQSASELAITVVNTVSANFTLSNLSQSGYTTKGEGHGNGLDNLRNVLRHNAHLKLMRRVTGMKLSITLVVEVA